MALVLPACTAGQDEVVVLAAASLGEAFTDIGAAFERDHPGVAIRLSLGPSSLLAAQLVAGAPGDVFASADRTQMETFLDSGPPVNREPEIFATNRIVVIVPATDPAGVASFRDLGAPGVEVVLAARDVPAGSYARGFLQAHSLLDPVLANVVSFESDVKEVLTKVRLGEADAGIVYRTDVTRAVAAEVRVIDLPDEPSTMAVYPIVAVSDDPSASRFVSFVLGEEGRSILARHGFGTP